MASSIPVDISKMISTFLHSDTYLVWIDIGDYSYRQVFVVGIFSDLRGALTLLLKNLYTRNHGATNKFTNGEWSYTYSNCAVSSETIDHDKIYIQKVLMNSNMENSVYYQIVGNKLYKTNEDRYCYVLLDKCDIKMYKDDHRHYDEKLQPSPSLETAEEIKLDFPELAHFKFARIDYYKYNEPLDKLMKELRGIPTDKDILNSKK
jgi:hypothetical protein